MDSLQLESRLGYQIGPSERQLLAYLAKNRFKTNKEITEDLQDLKSNISHRLKKLGPEKDKGKEGKGLVASTRRITPRVNDLWGLTGEGVAYVCLNRDMKIDIDKILTLYFDVDDMTKTFYALKEGFKAVKLHDYEKAVRDIMFRFASDLYDKEYAKTGDDKIWESKQENFDKLKYVMLYISAKYFTKMSPKDRRKYVETFTSIYGKEKVKKIISDKGSILTGHW